MSKFKEYLEVAKTTMEEYNKFAIGQKVKINVKDKDMDWINDQIGKVVGVIKSPLDGKVVIEVKVDDDQYSFSPSDLTKIKKG